MTPIEVRKPDVSPTHPLQEHVYDSQVKYQSVPSLHHEDGEVAYTLAQPQQSSWSERQVDLWPSSTHVRVVCQFDKQQNRGHGAFVGPLHVLTCGQYIHHGIWADAITVESSLGSVKVVKAYTFSQWIEQKDPTYNIALLILQRPIGENTGWNGMLAAPEDYLMHEEVMVGKRIEKHKVHQVDAEEFYYSNDEDTADSGSAISISRWKTAMIVGLKVLSKDQKPVGVRLTKPKLEAVATKIAENFYRSIQFGKAEWEAYFGDVGIEPPLPPNIAEILNSSCPFWPGKKVHETHLLVLVPQTVKGQPLTLKSLGELVQKPLKGHDTKYSAYYLSEYRDPPAPPSHWVLLTRDVIEGSRNKSYKEQQDLLAKYCKQAQVSYEVPKILDAAVCILMEHVRSGTRLYGREPVTFTRCQEKYNADWQLGVGGFGSSGLYICLYGAALMSPGVGGSRKF
jgi:hypothetical protein